VSLVAIIFTNKQDNDTSASGFLFPGLRKQINEISQVSISKAIESFTITNDSGRWVLTERNNYPVDIGKLRQLLLALADAKMLEEKTSDIEMYARLGVENIRKNSTGIEIRISGLDLEKSLILGKLAQRKYRYARIPGQNKSWLIDQNPDLPNNLGGWLLPEILDIDKSRIQAITITHSDGETIYIEKQNSEDGNFDVSNIPDGRELSYASVVNSIANVLSDLNLQEIAKASEVETDDNSVETIFRTFDGLKITINSSLLEDETWITVNTNQDEMKSEEAVKINEKLSGWKYQIQSYKGNQLRRRWDDILKSE
jgi:hypothetical protein